MHTTTLPEHRVVVAAAVVVGVAALHAVVVGSDDTEHCQWTHAEAVLVRRGHGDDPG